MPTYTTTFTEEAKRLYPPEDFPELHKAIAQGKELSNVLLPPRQLSSEFLVLKKRVYANPNFQGTCAFADRVEERRRAEVGLWLQYKAGEAFAHAS